MANLEDMIRSAVPDGNIAKPLMLALVGLLASGALFGSGSKGSSGATSGAQPASGQGAGGGLLDGLGGLLGKLQNGGLADVTKSWVGSGPNQPVSPGQLGSALGPDIIKHLLSERASPRKSLPSSCRTSCRVWWTSSPLPAESQRQQSYRISGNPQHCFVR